MHNALLTEINNLSVAERILLVEDIWDHLREDTDDSEFLLSDAQRTELDYRISHYQEQPEAGRCWNDVREQYLRSNRS
jgi:putative addiction module component (TIGR02574 family)